MRQKGTSSWTLRDIPEFAACALLGAVLLAGCGGGGGGSAGLSDSIAPTVVSSDPADGATDVAVDAGLRVTFSTPMDSATINGSTLTVRAGSSEVMGTIACTKKTVTFIPATNWAIDTTYTIVLSGGPAGVKDLAGNSLASTETRMFRTGHSRDKTAPAVTSTSPADAATGISVNTTVTATFSEAVANVTTSTFVVSAGGAPVSGSVTLDGATATLIPEALLARGTAYTATVTTGVTDLAGNALPSNSSWTFTTAQAPDTAPVAYAGRDQAVMIGSVVTLDGSGSSDAEGDPLTYAWSFTSKPPVSTATLSSSTSVTPTFNADVDGTYVLSLVVNDGTADSGADTVTVTATTAGTCTDWIVQDGRMGTGIGLLPDGRIVTIGGDSLFSEVLRFNADGSGRTRIGLFQGRGADLVVQPDGKVVILGTRQSSGGNDDLLLVRFRSDGSLDNTFGQEGVVAYDGGVSEAGYSVTLQPDGKIVATGFASDFSDGDVLLLRYNHDGTPDESFGIGGVVLYDEGLFEYGGRDVAVQLDGKIVVTGTVVAAAGTQNVLLLRYNADGTRDSTFGVNGVVAFDGGDWANGEGVAVQLDGRIVVTGGRGHGDTAEVLLLRFNVDGTPDTTFGDAGVATCGPSRGVNVALQSDGRIVVVGESTMAGVIFNVALVARFNANGTPDAMFGDGGVVSYDRGWGADRLSRVVLDRNGGIVAVGSSNVNATPYGVGGDLLLVRLTGMCQP